MLKLRFIIILTLISSLISCSSDKASEEYDICIYGSTSAGVIAAYTAAKAGKKVVLIDPGIRLGGMSAGGLGYTDIGNKFVVKGLALDFYRKLGKHYGKLEQWIFEPKVADSIFRAYLANCDATFIPEHLLESVDNENGQIRRVHFRDLGKNGAKSRAIEAKVFLDCSYEGDLMAKAGVSYHVGREPNSLYQETLNGVQLLDGHQFPDNIDPYQIKGDSSSGLVWGIREGELAAQGTGDDKVQAYNYRITLSNVPENRIPIEKPENYDSSRYELVKRFKELRPWKGLNDVFIWSLMPNGKTDINNRNGISTDMIGANWSYPEASYEERQKIVQAHEEYTKGLLYFVGHDPSVPKFIQDEMQQWGYPKDEYTEHGNWSPQLYIREARRMTGELVMTQHHCQGRERADDAVGYAAYTMDSHNCDRLVVNGMVKNEGNVEVGGFPPFPISYRAIVPKKKECSNLLVPVCLSASHIAYGSIRMEPVFMVLGQSAAVAACLAIDSKEAVQDVAIADIQRILKDNPKGDGRKPDVLLTTEDETHVQLTGQWRQEEKGGYGLSFQVADAPDRPSEASFTLPDLQEDRYQLYTYYPKLEGSTSEVSYHIQDARGEQEVRLKLKDAKIEGQTSGEWLPVGTYQAGGNGGKITIKNDNIDGLLPINAILLVPENDQEQTL